MNEIGIYTISMLTIVVLVSVECGVLYGLAHILRHRDDTKRTVGLALVILFDLLNSVPMSSKIQDIAFSHNIVPISIIGSLCFTFAYYIFITYGLKNGIWNKKPPIGYPLDRKVPVNLLYGAVIGLVIGSAFYPLWKSNTIHIDFPFQYLFAFNILSLVLGESIYRGRLLDYLEVRLNNSNKALIIQSLIYASISILTVPVNGIMIMHGIAVYMIIGYITGVLKKESGNLWMSTAASIVMFVLYMISNL